MPADFAPCNSYVDVDFLGKNLKAARYSLTCNLYFFGGNKLIEFKKVIKIST